MHPTGGPTGTRFDGSMRYDFRDGEWRCIRSVHECDVCRVARCCAAPMCRASHPQGCMPDASSDSRSRRINKKPRVSRELHQPFPMDPVGLQLRGAQGPPLASIRSRPIRLRRPASRLAPAPVDESPSPGSAVHAVFPSSVSHSAALRSCGSPSIRALFLRRVRAPLS